MQKTNQIDADLCDSIFQSYDINYRKIVCELPSSLEFSFNAMTLFMSVSLSPKTTSQMNWHLAQLR